MVALSDPAPPAGRYAVGEAPDAPAPIATDPLQAELARCRTLPANGDIKIILSRSYCSAAAVTVAEQ